MIKRLNLILILTLIVCFLNVVIAEEEVDSNYVTGKVVKVSTTQITITETNDDGEEMNVAYNVNKQTKYVNVDALKNIPVGKEVEIEYILKGSKKVALVITLVKEDEGDSSEEEGSDDEGSSEEEGY